jgi:hypothetical protein
VLQWEAVRKLLDECLGRLLGWLQRGLSGWLLGGCSRGGCRQSSGLDGGLDGRLGCGLLGGFGCGLDCGLDGWLLGGDIIARTDRITPIIIDSNALGQSLVLSCALAFTANIKPTEVFLKKRTPVLIIF